MPDVVSAASNFAITLSATISVAKFDARCRGWAITDHAADNLPLPEQVNGASNLERHHLHLHGKDAPVGLVPGAYPIEGEEDDYRMPCGWTYRVHVYSLSAEASRISFNRQAKAEIKAAVRSAVCAASPKIFHRSDDTGLIVSPRPRRPRRVQADLVSCN